MNREKSFSDRDARVLVATATYNERDNVEAFSTAVLSLCRESGLDPDLLVVDDASPDGTGDVLDRLSAREARLEVIHRPRKLGLGSAHKLAMLHALRGGYDVLVTLDADFSHDPAAIPELVERLGDADLVTGSRYMPGGRCDYTGYRRLVSRAASAAARALLRLPVHEFTTSFRAFRTDVLRRLDLSSVRSQGYSFFLESLYRIDLGGARLAEVPIHFRDRRAGQSKIPKLEVFRGIRKLGELVIHRFRSRRGDTPAQRPLPQERCPYCESRYILERFARRGGTASGHRAFRCTSMEHGSKPGVVSCLRCGLDWVPRREMHEELADLYAQVVDESYLRHAHGRRRTFRRAWDAIRPHLPERGRLFEIGCYCGLFLEVARDAGWDVRGVEPSRWAARIAREKGLDVRCGAFEDVDLAAEEGRYDAMVFWDVLEHLEDPFAALDKASRLLADGGVLCLSTLDTESWLPRLLQQRWPWYMDMHLFYFTRSGLEEALASAGLRAERVGPYCHYVPARYAAEKIASLAPRRLRGLLSPLCRLVPGRLLVPFRFGDIKLFVARKAPAGKTGEGVRERTMQSARVGTA